MSSSVFLSAQQAQDMVARQVTSYQPNPHQRDAHAAQLGETMVRMGLLTPEQVETVLARQAEKYAPFGRTAVKLGFIKHGDLKYALGVQSGILHETTSPRPLPEALVIANNPFSKEADAFHQLRASLLTGAAKDQLGLFAVSGADRQSQAAHLALNIAASIAQLGQQVALIDADLKTPRIETMMQMSKGPGVTDIVSGDAPYQDALRQTIVKNLNIIAAGTPVRDTQSVLNAAAFSETLETTSRFHDCVIVVTSSFAEHSDSQFVWSATNKVLALARKDLTRAETLSSMRASIRSAGAETIGAALVE